MQTLRDIAPYVALAAAALGVVALVIALVVWSGVRHVRRSQLVVMGRHEQRDIVALVEALDSQVRNLRDAVELLTDELDIHKSHLDRALTNRAILRYDAFRDAGGEQSASFALLDDYRSGVVFSAIAARDFARIYVKHLTNGAADRDLSPEEERVVAMAVPKPLALGEQSPRSARAPTLAGLDLPRTGRTEAEPAAEATAEQQPATQPRLPDPDDFNFTWDAADRAAHEHDRPPSHGSPPDEPAPPPA
jgi:hypothetical protein